ncbi:MAG: dihydrofolate synthase, partial [Acidimicrobiia bacterium]|nr:dihydrofolate synthase [Acidimicrobiia bacterium]
ETGLGGRLDATNAAEASVAVVTTIGLEHTEYLGDTIATIAGEKLAITTEGAPLVTGRLPADALEVAGRVAEDRSAPWVRLGTELRIGEVEMDDGGWLATIEGVYETYSDVFLALHGRHQVDNLAVAIGAVEALFGRALDVDAVREAAASIRCPGRMEIVLRDPLLMVDGAHNAPGMAVLVSALREEFAAQRWEVVFGVMSDKSIEEMLLALGPVAAGFHMVAADSERAVPSADLAGMAASIVAVPVADAGSVTDGLAAARATGRPVLVAGSLFVVGEARLALGLA